MVSAAQGRLGVRRRTGAATTVCTSVRQQNQTGYHDRREKENGRGGGEGGEGWGKGVEGIEEKANNAILYTDGHQGTHCVCVSVCVCVCEVLFNYPCENQMS